MAYVLEIIVKGSEQGVSQAANSVDQLGGGLTKMSALGAAAFAGVTAGAVALGAGLVSSINVAGDFEAGMNQFAAAAGSSLADAGLSIEDFRNQFIQLGTELPVSTTEVQQAAIALIKGGLDPATVSAGALKDSLLFAAAAEMDLTSAAELGVKMLGTFGPIAGTAAEQTAFLASTQDLLVQAAGASTLNVDKLGDAMLQAGGAAKGAGVDTGDFITTMGLISPAFGSASEAGTSYKNFLSRLAPSTKPALEAMNNLGLMTVNTGEIMDFLRSKGIQPLGNDLDTLGNQFTEWATAQGMTVEEIDKVWNNSFAQSKFFDEATGKFVGNQQAAELLQNALSGLSDVQRTEALNAIFGNDAKGAAIALAAAGAEGYEAFTQKMAAANGVQAQAAATQQGFNIAFDNFKGSIEAAQIVIGSALIPILTTLLNNVLAPGIGAVTAFAQAFIAASDPFAFMVDQLNALLPGLGSFVAFVTDNIIPILSSLAAMILAVVVPAFWTWAFAAETGAVATVTALLPVIAPIVAIGAAVALLVAAWQNDFMGIQGIVATVWSYIEPIFTQLVAWLSAQIPVAIAALAALWSGTLMPALSAFGGFIMGTVVPALMQIGAWLSANIPAAVNAAVAAFQTIAGVVSTVVATVVGIVSGMASGVQAAIGAVVTVVQAAWNTINFITSAAWNAIAGVIGPPLATAAAAVSGAVNSIVSALQAGWAAVVSATAPAWNAVTSAVQTAISAVQGIVAGVVATVQSIISGGWAQVETATSGPWQRVQSIISGVMTIIQTAIRTGVEIVKTIMAGAWAVVVAAAQNDFGRIPQIIGAVWDRVKGIFGEGVAAIRAIASDIAAAAMSLGSDIVSGVVNGIKNGIGAVINAAKDLAQSALDAAMGLLDSHSPSREFAKVGETIPQGMAVGITAASPEATGAMADLAGKLFDTISKGMSALGALGGYRGIGMDGLVAFATDLGNAVRQFHAGILAAGKQAIAAAEQFSEGMGKMLDTLGKGVEAFEALRGFKAIGWEAAAGFAYSLMLLVQNIANAANAFRGDAVGAAAVFAEAAGKVLAILKSGVEGFAALADLAPLPPLRMKLFADMVQGIIFRLWEVATRLRADMVGAAVGVAEGVGKVVAVIGSAVEGFAALQDLTALPPLRMKMFADMVQGIIFRMWEVSQRFSKDMVQAAASFAEGVGKVVGVIGNAVQGFAALQGFQAVPADAFKFLGWALNNAVFIFWNTALDFNQQAIDTAAAFGESVGKVVGVIGTAVQGFTALQTFQAVPGDAFKYLGWALNSAVFIFWNTALDFDAAALEVAAAFGESVGKVVGVIGTAVEGFAKLKDLGPISTQAINMFAVGLKITMAALATVAANFGAEALTHAKTFAEAAGAAVGILKNGVEGLLLVNTFSGSSASALGRFAEGVKLAVAAMARLAAEFGMEATAAAQAFAKAAGESTDFLKKGVDGFIQLGKLTAIPRAGMVLFAEGVVEMINMIISLANILSTDVLLRANQFSNAIDTVIATIQGGLKALADLGGQAGNIQMFTDALVRQVNQVAAALAARATPASVSMGQNIALGIAAGITSGAPAIQNAVFAAVNAALLAAKQALGIASPSKVFEEQIGAQMSAGMAQGIAGGAPQIDRAVSDVSSGALRAGNTTNNTTNMGGMTIVQQPGQSAEQLYEYIRRRMAQDRSMRPV